MKKWKRLFSLVCAFAMIFSLNATAFAAELPIADTKQQYEIYDCSCDTLHWNSKQHEYNLWS